MTIAPDGIWLATAGLDNTVRFWSVPDQRSVAMTRAEGVLVSCSWGAAGELAVGGERGLYLFALLT